MNVLAAGDSALLVELEDLDSVLALYSVLRADLPDGVIEAVPAARTVLLLCDPQAVSLAAIEHALRRLQPAPHRRPAEEPVEIPSRYDGPDIDDVLAATGMTRSELIDWHTGSSWQVAFCGFAPGFGYLVTDSGRTVPRRDSPRTSVPAGSIGLAGEFSGVYPRASPGGWQLIGRTEATLFDLDADPPALLRPGVGVRFVDCG
ncbi:MAG: allophanate hydrolase subunit 1 [Actinomycetota bacterium]|nr:allophanate hydrolase subunit 1 [Actinomycetota bacterium]